MTAWQHWVRFPQSLSLRKAFFQSLYVLLISVSGALIVYRPQLSKRFNRPEIILAASRPQLTVDQLNQAAQRDFPGYRVANIFQSRRPDRPIAIALERRNQRMVRFSIRIPAATWATPCRVSSALSSGSSIFTTTYCWDRPAAA